MWVRGKVSIAVLARNFEAIGFWYDNYECAPTLAVELLSIQKAVLVCNNFPNHHVQVKNDCKIIIEAL